MKKIFAVAFITILIISCKEKKSKPNEFELVKDYSVSFSLDKETGYFQSYISRNIHKEIEYLSYINGLNNTIYYYDVNFPDKINKIALEIKGPNGVGKLSSISGLLFLNPNKIFVYNAFTGLLYLVNKEGQVLKKYEIFDPKGNVLAFPEINNLKPFFLKENSIYFPCGLLEYKTNYDNSLSVIKLDLKTEKVIPVLNYPDKYNKGFWGSSFKYIPSVIPLENSIVASFPIKNKLVKYNLNNQQELTEFEASSYYFHDKIKPYSSDIQYNLENRNYESEDNFSLSESDYISLIHDSSNNYFYRICHLRKDKNENREFRPDISIIILDKNFNVIGETLLDGNIYDHIMIVKMKNGLGIARRDLYKKNENELTFDIFKPLKN